MVEVDAIMTTEELDHEDLLNAVAVVRHEMEKLSKLVSLLRHRSAVSLLGVHRRERKNVNDSVEGKRKWAGKDDGG